jgi:hypothetical protein
MHPGHTRRAGASRLSRPGTAAVSEVEAEAAFSPPPSHERWHPMILTSSAAVVPLAARPPLSPAARLDRAAHAAATVMFAIRIGLLTAALVAAFAGAWAITPPFFRKMRKTAGEGGLIRAADHPPSIVEAHPRLPRSDTLGCPPRSRRVGTWRGSRIMPGFV